MLRSIYHNRIYRIIDGDPFYHHYEDVNRAVWQPIMLSLFEALGIETHESYVCDLFEIHAYDYEAECDCGWDSSPFWDWLDRLQHAEECIHTKYLEFERIYGLGAALTGTDSKFYDAKLLEWFGEIYRQHGVDISSPHWYRGIAVACTCNYTRRILQKLKEMRKAGEQIGHQRQCRLLRPNFWYKPTDFRLWWYKYPLRGAERSQQISDAEFASIIVNCIQFVR